MELEAILAELGVEGGAPARLGVGPTGEVIVEKGVEDAAAYLHLPLGAPALDGAGTIGLYEKLLEANLPGDQLRGAVFAIDPEEGQILLQRRVPLASLVRAADLVDRAVELQGVAVALARVLGLTLDWTTEDVDDAA